MAEPIEIPLPDTEKRYRAWHEDNAIRFEPEVPRRSLRLLGLAVVLSMGIMPAVVYGITLGVLAYTGQQMHWSLHLAFGTVGIIFLIVAGRQALDIAQFRGSILRRENDGTLTLTWLLSGNRTKIYRIAEPAHLMILLHRDIEATRAVLELPGDDGAKSSETFHDVVEVDLKLESARVTPRMSLLTRRWVDLIPRFLGHYLREHDPDTACQNTATACRPLADAVRNAIGIPVEIHQAGGCFRMLLNDAGPDAT